VAVTDVPAPLSAVGWTRTEEGTMTVTTTDLPTDLPADLHAALDRVADALAAMFTGDPEPYATLWAPGHQPTLFGAWGPCDKGHQTLMTTFRWVASRFSDGQSCRPRYRVVDWSGDLAYTVGFEEGEVRVDGGRLVPMTLRVTHVLRRIDGEWRLVHRHADYPPRDQRP
jgi:ketosteroid isomerase-like protein